MPSDMRKTKAQLLEEIRELRQCVQDLRGGVVPDQGAGGGPHGAEEIVRALTETVEDSIFIKDTEFRYTFVNRAMEQALGLPASELIGKTPEEIFDEEDAAIVATVDKRALAGETVDAMRTLTIDGVERTFHTVQAPVRGSTGQIDAICGIVRDVTERRQAEEAFRESETRFRSIVESSPMGMFTYELQPDGRLILTGSNPATRRILGVDVSPHYGETIEEVFPPLAETEVPDRYRRAASSGEPWQSEQVDYEYGDISGAYEVHAFQTSPGKMAVMFLDITERKRAEEALIESRERFRVLVENAPEAIVVLDFDQGRFVDANENAVRLYKMPRNQLLEVGPIAVSPPFQPNGRPSAEMALEMIQQAIDGGTPTFEWTHRDSEGNDISCEIRLVRLPSATQRLVRGSVTDITERKRAEEERLSLERQVQHAQKLESLGVLAGGIAHDFNNILVSILGYADLALEDMSPHAPSREYLKEIEQGARRAADLASQMLAYSGKGRFELEGIDLNEFVEEMAHLLEVSTSKKALLRYNFADNLPSIKGDATQIRQVIMNLITNASEAVGDSSGVISVSTGAMDCDSTYLQDIRVREQLPEGTYIYVEVADTGCGMDKETQGKIFDPFFTTKFTGRGLGMAAVQGIMRGHDGAIKVYSEPGRGSTFKALFPISGEAADRAVGPSAGIEEDGWVATGTILLVDDEDTVCTMGRRMLEKLGFEVLTASEGREALDLFRDNVDDVACVLLDLTMPHMDGEECFRELRRIKEDVRVVLSSGYNENDVTQRFAGKGLQGFIHKPYRLATLRSKLRKALEG